MRKILLLLSLLCGVSGYAEVRTVKFRTGSFLPYAEETLPEKNCNYESQSNCS